MTDRSIKPKPLKLNVVLSHLFILNLWSHILLFVMLTGSNSPNPNHELVGARSLRFIFGPQLLLSVRRLVTWDSCEKFDRNRADLSICLYPVLVLSLTYFSCLSLCNCNISRDITEHHCFHCWGKR